MTADLIPQRVIEKLMIMLAHDDYKQSRVLYFLASQPNNPRYIQILECTLNNDNVFLETVNNILRDMAMAENDQSYAQVMADIWNRSLVPGSATGDGGQRFDLNRILSDKDRAISPVVYSLTTTLAKMPRAQQAHLMDVAFQVSKAILGESGALVVVNNTKLQLVALSRYGKLVPIALIGIQLSYEVYRNIRLWWKGEISGERCAKNIIDSGVGIAAGVAGGMGGAALGSWIMPGVGTIFGGIIGAIASAELASVLSDRLTQLIFDLPKSVALENAYRFLELSPKVSNDEVNSQFRKLALKYHPDKPGGSNEQFQLLQSHVGVIKASREEGQT